jgi:hypothetical protein
MSGNGSLYGHRINHTAALAATCRERSEIPQDGPSLKQVAQYPRAGGAGLPFRVIHDLTINRPYGRYAVYLGEKRLGAQLSFPSEADCRRMESPPPLCEPYEKRLSPEQRMALGMLVNPEAARTSGTEKSIRSKRVSALQRGRAIHQSIYRKHDR